MKLLHIADLHMDRSFEGLPDLPEALAEKLRTANRQVLHQLVDAALTNQVDAVIFSGDTFHQSRTSIQTQAYFFEELQRLASEEIHVIISFGNHDYFDPERYWFNFPENVYLFEKEEVETHYFITKQNERVAVSGFSYLQPWIEESKLPEYPARSADSDIHIGVYHGDVSMGDQSRYAPFSLGEMKAFGYDYWALGHIHQPQILSADPLIVYPGTPQGHTKKEQGIQGAGLVTLGDHHAATQFISVEEVRWEYSEYSLADCQTKKEALAYLEAELLRQAHQYNTFILNEIQLNDTHQLGEEFVMSCENGEILAYLQQALANQVQNLFVFQLSVKESSAFQKILVTADPRLLDQLEKNYLQPEIFMEATKELQQHPVISHLGLTDEAWRKNCVKLADQRIKERFRIQEDQ
ncbi:DNA repair exonuclease [Enterococcus sp. BWT-B8]|uniref:metallophosphoesterase family protein n=1 Tax=Enterococcus sp. BWT-B8 TaxID=2885157 RepID=UPI001E2FBFB5|nr:DNA repair exonuclease [Enterococcus sp. BWT-B8]MCB5952776.1 DNA repair exonuclease [Enterococcus sp. BWT-B8]